MGIQESVRVVVHVVAGLGGGLARQEHGFCRWIPDVIHRPAVGGAWWKRWQSASIGGCGVSRIQGCGVCGLLRFAFSAREAETSGEEDEQQQADLSTIHSGTIIDCSWFHGEDWNGKNQDGDPSFMVSGSDKQRATGRGLALSGMRLANVAVHALVTLTVRSSVFTLIGFGIAGALAGDGAYVTAAVTAATDFFLAVGSTVWIGFGFVDETG